jgi:predicted AlkP superfamily phosphohydrolase/phosphomutase
VLLLRNIDKEVKDKVPSIVSVAPSILDLFGLDWKEKRLDGKSIYDEMLKEVLVQRDHF